MSVVSGELYYSMGGVSLPISSFLTDYLSCDRSLEFQKKINNKRMEQLLQLKQKVLKNYFEADCKLLSCFIDNNNTQISNTEESDSLINNESKVKPLKAIQKVSNILIIKRNLVIESARRKLFYAHDKLEHLRSLNDATLMKLVLEYGTLCRKEVERSRRLLSNESSAANDAKEHSKKIHDLFLFAHHVAAESHHMLKLSILNYDTPASVRCRKAVYDNTKKGYLESMCIDKLHIDTVIKVENEVLSDYLEVNDFII